MGTLPKTCNPPPQKKRNFTGMEIVLQKEPRKSQAPIKFDAAISGPRIAGRIFLCGYQLSDPNRSDFELQIASDCNRYSKKSLRLRRHLYNCDFIAISAGKACDFGIVIGNR